MNSILDKRHIFKTARHLGLNRFCALRRWNPERDEYLCNFGFRDVWIPARELAEFCL
jgi:hypothetical protein